MTVIGSDPRGAAQYGGGSDGGGAHYFCGDCRTSGGAGRSSHMFVPEATFDRRGDLNLRASPAGHGHVVNRRFCPACGSPGPSTISGAPGLIFARASTLDDPAAFVAQIVAYASRARSSDPVTGKLPAFDEMPPIGGK